MTEARPTRRRRNWVRMVVITMCGVLVTVCALVALAPTLVSAGVGKGMIESLVGEAVNGSARIDSLTLSWLGQQRIKGLEVKDRQGQTLVSVDAGIDNGLLALLRGRVDSLRVSVSGSVEARMLPAGGTSLSNLASSAPATPKTPAASGDPLASLPFPLRLTIGSFDVTLRDEQGVAFAVRGLKGSVSLGRSEPLVIDLGATTQVREQAGSLAVKGRLERFLDTGGQLDLRDLSGEMDAQVSGWLLAYLGASAEVQAAAVRVEAPAGKSIGVAVNSSVRLDGMPVTAQAQMTAARPAPGRDVMAWASDPRTWIGQVSIKGVPTAFLQRFVQGTPLVLARDVGPAVDALLQTGEGAGVDLAIVSSKVQLSARAIVDPSTGAMQGDGITLQATLDPALLAQFGTVVDSPLQVTASAPSLRTPPISVGGSLDPSAIALQAEVQVQPFQMLQVAPQPIRVGALTLGVTAEPLGQKVDVSLQGSVQQAPIQLQAQLTGLGSELAISAAQFQGTLASGPLDPIVLPGLPADARRWLALAQPGASTLRASAAGSIRQGSAQVQLDSDLGSVTVKPAWSPDSVTVDKVEAALTLAPALLGQLADGQLAFSAPVKAQLAAGPVRIARGGELRFEAIPLQLALPAVDLARVPGVGGPVSLRDARVDGGVDPDGPSLFDGRVSLASAVVAKLDGVGAVQLRGLATQARLASDLKAIALSATLGEAACPAVPGLAGPVAVRDAKVTVEGSTDLGPGTSASFELRAHDATGVIASVRGTFEPQASGWRAGVGSDDVDMRRALALVGQGGTLPDWVGAQGSRSFAANVAGGPGGVSFGVNASLDPISLQAQGSRNAAGTITLSKGSLQAKLPASVLKSFAERTGTVVAECDPMQLEITVHALTLPSDATGSIQPFASGASIDVAARIEPWRVRAEDSPMLAFGANELTLKSRAGTGASARLTGSLGAEGTPPAPLDISLQTAQLLDEQGRFAPGRGSVTVAANVKDFPTRLADRLSGMDGTLVDMLGPTFTLNVDGRSGTAPQDVFKATFTSPTLTIDAPAIRLAASTLSIDAGAPITAELRPDARFREKIMKPLNPVFADIETTQPIRATVQSLRMPLPVEVRQVDTAVTIDVGEVAVRKSNQLLALLDYVVASPQKAVPVKFMPLQVRVANGLLTYRDFHMFIGKLNRDTWQYPIFGEAQINLAAEPAYADFIDIRYPYTAIASTAGKFKGARAGLAEVDRWLETVPGAKDVVQSLQQKVRFTGPLKGDELQMEFYPIHLPEGMGGKVLDGIQKGIGNAIDDLFRKPK